ncbi:hypothetical protein L1276_002526 [Flavobacterium sp. HSC-32F16]|uniref:T9SS sorting signal type C domain-containing protein n=1 Tax=Flavobacterium sp. HSC-32F16 TaxID=2910964 RepID=UPI0020A3C2FF|nr:T9SS sorting signal type C domain-containing protein [Flavobacterium sp. HSC-32F16]MCP2027369.1 hypothetical protein [Flavobacterium sp. HSC-32F16]
MKKHFFSTIYFFVILWIFLFNPIPVQGTAVPVNSSFLRCNINSFSSSFSSQEIIRHRVWLNLTNDEGLFKQILIGYISGATNGWDHNYDAVTMDANKYADFYSINDDKNLVIQGRAIPIDPEDTIPLGYKSNITGDLKISIDQADGDLTDADIYLHDNETGIIHNLKYGPYTFSTLNGTFNNRFVLRHTNRKLEVDEFKTISRNFTVVSKDKIITLRSSDNTLKEVEVFDVTGKLLYIRQKIGTSELEINSIRSGTQILLVKTTFENEYTITRKVLF